MKLTEIKSTVKDSKAFKTKDGLAIIASTDNTPKWGDLLHVSISRLDKYPSWDEIVQVKLQFFGDRKDAMMLIPKRTDYVNVHENCFHLWECPEEWGLQ